MEVGSQRSRCCRTWRWPTSPCSPTAGSWRARAAATTCSRLRTGRRRPAHHPRPDDPDGLPRAAHAAGEELRRGAAATTGLSHPGDELELRDGQRLLARFKAQIPK